MNGRTNVLKRQAGLFAALLLLVGAGPLSAQDSNILLPVDSIERLLSKGEFQVVDTRGSRFAGDRTNRAALSFPDGTMLVAKWARAAPGGAGFNNEPRYEAAAYEFQKLFLDEPDYVVPPTVLRAFPIGWYRTLEAGVQPTFPGTGSVVVALQYWLFNVTDEGFWDEARFAADTAYARHFADFNVLTYLIKHNDANRGNFLVSGDPTNPRVFAVDNGLSFASVTSDRGAAWRQLRVRRLPRHTVERLRSITEEDLHRVLGTVAEFRVGAHGLLHAVEPTGNLSPNRGVRHEGEIVQFGLTRREIHDTWRRLRSLLEDVDKGRYELF